MRLVVRIGPRSVDGYQSWAMASSIEELSVPCYAMDCRKCAVQPVGLSRLRAIMRSKHPP